jgi:hypothetical protein
MFGRRELALASDIDKQWDDKTKMYSGHRASKFSEAYYELTVWRECLPILT